MTRRGTSIGDTSSTANWVGGSYTWGPKFNIRDFKHQIDVFNLRQITEWLTEGFLEDHDLEEDGDEFKAAMRLTYGTTATAVLNSAHDVVLPVLLPCNFAAFANKLVSDAQAGAGLKVSKILKPAAKSHKHLVVNPESDDTTEGLFLWRIGRDLMWQQLDRRIDESVVIPCLNGRSDQSQFLEYSRRCTLSTASTIA